MVQVVLPASPDMKIIHLSYTHQNKALHSMYYVAVVQTHADYYMSSKNDKCHCVLL